MVLSAWANGDLPHHVYLVFTGPKEAVLLNMKTRKYKTYMQGGKFLLRKPDKNRVVREREVVCWYCRAPIVMCGRMWIHKETTDYMKCQRTATPAYADNNQSTEEYIKQAETLRAEVRRDMAVSGGGWDAT